MIACRPGIVFPNYILVAFVSLSKDRLLQL
jgi:hypothetical protein